jgi:hypothetical protein
MPHFNCRTSHSLQFFAKPRHVPLSLEKKRECDDNMIECCNESKRTRILSRSIFFLRDRTDKAPTEIYKKQRKKRNTCTQTSDRPDTQTVQQLLSCARLHVSFIPLLSSLGKVALHSKQNPHRRSLVHRDRLAVTFSTTLARPAASILHLHRIRWPPSSLSTALTDCRASTGRRVWRGVQEKGPSLAGPRPGAASRRHAMPPSSATGWPELAVPHFALRHPEEG